MYELGTLQPGESARLGPMAKRSDLKTLLTGRRAVRDEGENYRQQTTPYDQSSTDIPYILRMMMFYKAAGGRSYTGLWNDYQGFVDLSDLLKADRAILDWTGGECQVRTKQVSTARTCFATANRWASNRDQACYDVSVCVSGEEVEAVASG